MLYSVTLHTATYQLFFLIFLFSVHNCYLFLLKTFKALNGILCADVPLRNYSLTHSHVILFFNPSDYIWLYF